MPNPNPKPESEQKSGQRTPRNLSNPAGSHHQELDPKGGSKTEGDEKRDSFSGEKMPKH